MKLIESLARDIGIVKKWYSSRSRVIPTDMGRNSSTVCCTNSSKQNTTSLNNNVNKGESDPGESDVSLGPKFTTRESGVWELIESSDIAAIAESSSTTVSPPSNDCGSDEPPTPEPRFRQRRSRPTSGPARIIVSASAPCHYVRRSTATTTSPASPSERIVSVHQSKSFSSPTRTLAPCICVHQSKSVPSPARTASAQSTCVCQSHSATGQARIILTPRSCLGYRRSRSSSNPKQGVPASSNSLRRSKSFSSPAKRTASDQSICVCRSNLTSGPAKIASAPRTCVGHPRSKSSSNLTRGVSLPASSSSVRRSKSFSRPAKRTASSHCNCACQSNSTTSPARIASEQCTCVHQSTTESSPTTIIASTPDDCECRSTLASSSTSPVARTEPLPSTCVPNSETQEIVHRAHRQSMSDSGVRPKERSHCSCSYSAPSATGIASTVHQYSSSHSSSVSSGNGQIPQDAVPDKDTIMKLHASAIGHMTRRTLSLHMNPPKLLGNDWKGLADYMGFSMLEIQNFELSKDPMEQVLKEWLTQRDSTIGALVEMITDLEREDVLMTLEEKLKKDAKNWLKKQQQSECSVPPVQVPVVSGSSYSQTYPNLPITPELRGITLNDNPDGPIETFDAYVCHNPDTDYNFVLDMIEAMEKPPYNLRFCTDWRDLVPGGSYATATAELIENRCKRMIVVLSPEFLESGHCDFQAKFALALSPGVRSKRMVPIMVKPCTPPNILRHITVCDYTKTALRRYFWNRLFCALDLQCQKEGNSPSDAAELSHTKYSEAHNTV